MATKKPKPTFLLLSARLPSLEPGHLLGRFVTHPSRPLDNYAPENPSTIIGSETITIAETHSHTTLSATSNAHLRTALQGLLDLTTATSHTNTHSLDSTYIKTYRLRNHYKAFDKLEADPMVREDLDGAKGLFTRSRGKLYMIIGFKTCAPGSSFSSEVGRGWEHAVEVTVPLSSLVTGVPFVDVVDPSVGVGVGRERGREGSFVTEGEQVFAVEYKVVKQRNVFGFHAQGVQPVLAHNPMTHEWENSVYSDVIPVRAELRGKFDDGEDEDDFVEDVDEDEDDVGEKRLEMFDDEELAHADMFGESREQLLMID